MAPTTKKPTIWVEESYGQFLVMVDDGPGKEVDCLETWDTLKGAMDAMEDYVKGGNCIPRDQKARATIHARIINYRGDLRWVVYSPLGGHFGEFDTRVQAIESAELKDWKRDYVLSEGPWS